MANKKVSQLTSKPSVLVTDLFPIADPSTGQLYKTTISDLGTAIGSGVSSVNTLVGAVVLDTDDIQELASPTNKWFTDTRARAALSASSPLAYNSGTGVFSIPQATSSQNGFLSSADWTTFNAKQAALSGTGFVKISGTTISYDNSTYLTTSAAASTYLALSGGTLTGALNGTSATFTGDLTISSANPRLYFTDSDNNPDYFISNTDGTFTVYDVTNSTARFTIGTTGNATFANAITGGGSITGTALYSTGIISAGTSLSVGTTISASGSITGSALYVTGMTAGSGAIYHTASRLTFANYNASGTLHFEVNGGTGALTINADKSATFESTISTIQGIFYNPAATSNTTYIGHSNTGAYLGTAVTGKPLYFETEGTTRLTIASTGAATFSSSVTAGSLSINTTTTDGRIDVRPNGLSSFPIYWRNNNGGYGGGIYVTGGNNMQMYLANSAGTENVLIAATGTSYFNGGNVGIGTTAPQGGGGSTDRTLSINSGAGAASFVTGLVGDVKYSTLFTASSIVVLETNAAIPLAFNTNATERMRITSAGKLLVGGTSDGNTGLVQIHGTARSVQLVASEGGITAGNYAVYGHDDNNGYINVVRSVFTGDFHFRFDGTSRANINRSTGAYTATSDSRLKTNISDSQSVLSLINQIKVRSYKWIENDMNEAYGLIAQELYEILPEYVYKPKIESENWGLSKAELVPMLVKAVQELSNKIKTLENK